MNRRALKSAISCTALFLLVFAIAVVGATAQTSTQGQWTTLSPLMPINPVHVALMNNGKVLIVSGSGNDPSNTNLRAAVWDPASGTYAVQTVTWDMFCNGMVVLPDGRPVVMGGTLQYDPFYGQKRVTAFDPVTGTFADLQNMAHGRWYPTATTLGDGRVMIFSGSGDTGATNNAVEIFTPGTGWSAQFTATWTPPLYPRMHLLPNGKVFYSGSTTTSRLFDPTAHTWTTVGNTISSTTRTYGTSVLLPLTPANGFDPRVIIMGGGSPAIKTTEIIDMGAATPSWKQGPPMSQERTEMNAVILPNGKVLALGGSLNDEDGSTASLNVDMLDPSVNPATFTTVAPNVYARLYHSNALLLPDATVLLVGGNPTRGTYEQHVEIYKPPYLFNANNTPATRPTISGVTANISWNNTFTVNTPDAANISSVVLIRPGAPTHAFDMDQRMVGMSFTKGSGTLTVTAPLNGNIAPPGYYMLFVLNSSGVPSVAAFTKLGTAPAAPTVTSITPNSGAASGGTSVTITGTGFQVGATVSLGGTAATGVTVGSSTSITATTAAHAAGLVNVVVTNPDSQSGTLANGFTYANGAPNVSSVSPNSGTIAGGTPVTITGSGFLAGATVKFGGTAATGVTIVNSTSITATTPAHAAGAVSVVVTNTDAQSGTLNNGYTYTTGTGGGGTIAFVQMASSNPQTPAANLVLGFDLAQTAGNLNVVAVGWNDTTSTVTSVTDTRGNTYAQAGTTVTGTGLRQAIFYAKNIAAGSNTVTVSFNQAAAFVDVRMAEYSGLDTSIPLDVTAGAIGTGGTPNSGAATTNSAKELIFGAGMTGSHFGGAGAGFTSRVITNPDGDIIEDQIVSATGSYSAVAPLSYSSAWVMQMATFRASGQGGSNPAPIVSSIAPTSGTASGGTPVTITGTGFLSGATVSFGGTAATGVTVVNSTSITATTPAHAAGAVNVVVTNTDAQTGTLTNGYTYNAANPAPTVTSITPNSGNTTGGTAVTITGTGFLAGATVKLGGTAATGVVVVNSTSITANTSAHAAGAVSVVVTNTDAQAGTLNNGYTYTAANPAPTVTAITPNSGTANGGTPVTITGTGFLAGATVSLGGTAATGVVVVNSTSITANTPAHAGGAVSVSVTNTDAQTGTLNNGYTYINPAPTVTSITPNSGTANGGTPVTITGTGFLAGATVSLGGTAATGVTVVNSTSITATTAAHTAATVSVVVTNTDAQSGTLANGYTYNTSTGGGGPVTFVQLNAADPQSSVASVPVSFSAAQTAGNLNVVAVGWNDATSTVSSVTDSRGNTYTQAGTTLTGSGMRQAIYYAKSIAAGSNTVTVAFNQAAAFPDIRIAEYSGADTSSPLDVTAGGIGTGGTPNSGAATTSSASELIFGAGMTTSHFGAAGSGFTSRIITSPDGDIAEDRSVSATGSYSATAALSYSGGWIMQMATFRGGSGGGTGNPAPTVASITPNSGTANGGTPVTITGTGFLSGATVSLGGTAATGITVVNSTTITATTAAHAAGAASVVVTNTDAQNGTLANGYTYTSSTGGTIAFVQVNAADPQSPATSVPVAYPAAQTAGNLNVVAVGWNDTTSTVSSVTDSRGNTYTQAGTTLTGSGMRQAIYYAKNIAAGSNTVTVAFNQAAAFVDVRVLEYSGIDTTSPLDVTAGAIGTGGTPSSGAATTTSASELIVGAGMTTSHFSGAGSGFTSRVITSPDGDIAVDRVVSAAGSNSATATLSYSGGWIMQMATFKAKP